MIQTTGGRQQQVKECYVRLDGRFYLLSSGGAKWYVSQKLY